MRSAVMPALAIAVSIAAVGCSSGGDGVVAPSAPSASTVPRQQAPTAPPPSSDATPPPGSPGAPARPLPDACVPIPEAPDGVYRVFDAGTATVVREGDRLTPVSSQAAPGWTVETERSEPDEVDVEFRRGAEQLDLEVEIDDGRLTVEICADDD